VQAGVDVADLKHLIPRNDLLSIPRPGRHSHFSVRLALDNDRDLVARRDFFENFFGLLIDYRLEIDYVSTIRHR
jgi:hypothetical protein